MPEVIMDGCGSGYCLKVTKNGENINIDRNFSEISKGNHYFVSNFEIVDSGNSVNFAVTPIGNYPYMTFDIYGTSQTEMRVYANSTVSGGTTGTPINNNFSSSNTSSTIVKKNPSVSASGTLVFAQSRGLAGATPYIADFTGTLNREKELVLNPGSTYLFAIKSVDNDNVISYIGEWFELDYN
jgi:hypothetical protein